MKKSVRIKVPATSANLGPGFDVLGIALKLYNEIQVSRAGTADTAGITIEGAGRGSIPADERNIVWKAMEKVFGRLSARERGKYSLSTLHIRLINHIPLTSGLGSSAAARLGGILAANALCGYPLSPEEALNTGVSLEGHPDNIVPAMVGGLCVSLRDNGEVTYIKLAAPKMKAVVVNPDFELPTEQARKVLPKRLSIADMVFNSSRLALLLAALGTKQYHLLGKGMEDCLHQPFREPLIPGMRAVFKAALASGAYSAAVSGSGPSLIAFVPAAKAGRVARAMRAAWKKRGINGTAYVLDFDTRGARIAQGRAVSRQHSAFSKGIRIASL